MLLSAYNPPALFRFFEEISAIPRPSGGEEAIADYLVAFAAGRGLDCFRDDHHNVLIRKPAAPGYEDHPVVLLQGHTDMVCEKNAGVEHDFARDPLKLQLEGDFLSASGTTLGGDDGAAVALMLAALDDPDLTAPALECLFTTAEETGLSGASAFDYSRVNARMLINLDSEEEGTAWVGSAGSEDTALIIARQAVPLQNRCLRVSVSGLAGGHSGTDIDKCRANANLLLLRILGALYDRTPFNLVEISGGRMRNAIPREASAVIAVVDREEAAGVLRETAREIRSSLGKADRGMKLRVDKCGAPGEEMLTFRCTGQVLAAGLAAPAGVQAMSPYMENLVESSTNLGVISADREAIRLEFMSRSSVEAGMDLLEARFNALAKLAGEEIRAEHTGRYGGWAFRPGTALQKRYLDAAEKVLGRPGKVAAVHAGLECAIICAGVKAASGEEMDAISIGPDIFDIHSPDERMDCRSLERLWQLVCTMLAGI